MNTRPLNAKPLIVAVTAYRDDAQQSRMMRVLKKEGIARANKYLQDLDAVETDNDKVQKVFWDVMNASEKGPLGTSTDLRNDLKKALFTVLGVTGRQIVSAERTACAQARPGIVGAGVAGAYGAVVALEAAKAQARDELLKSAVRAKGLSIVPSVDDKPNLARPLDGEGGIALS